MNMQQFVFGTTKDGREVTAYKIEDGQGLCATILDYGCTVQSLLVPNAAGGVTDVVQGYDTLAEYEENGGYFGAAIGRVGNRIAKGRFSLNGKEYILAQNDGENHLHGGDKGFDKFVWKGEALPGGVRFSRLSADGEEGYPGNLELQITYTLKDGGLCIRYEAVSDADTLLNLTNHSYFNLDGGESILEHEVQIDADAFCENDAGCLPTGRLLEVAGTPFDFRAAKPIGRDIGADDVQLKNAGGYDHNYALNGQGMRQVARLKSPKSGICMAVHTDMPGMQLYSGNFTTARAGKNGAPILHRGALCLETQLHPDGIHHKNFPSPVLPAGQKFQSETTYVFSVG